MNYIIKHKTRQGKPGFVLMLITIVLVKKIAAKSNGNSFALTANNSIVKETAKRANGNKSSKL